MVSIVTLVEMIGFYITSTSFVGHYGDFVPVFKLPKHTFHSQSVLG